MAISPQKQLDEHIDSADTTLAKALAPEDIRPGDYVALLHVVYEVPSYFWCADASMSPRDELVRLQFVPESSGLPLKVQSVCLPYVLVKHPQGKRKMLDIRRCTLARLGASFAKTAWKVHRGKPSRKNRNR